MKLQNILLSLLLAALAAAAPAQTKGPLRVGVTGLTAEAIEVAAQEAKKQGIDVKVITFSDWTTPNAALDAGDLDVNYFQHQAFLDAAIKQRGYKLKSVGLGFLYSVGLFSNKFKRIDDIKEGARFGIHNDPANQARTLRFLEQLGLIKLRPGVGNWATLTDITDNPKKLKFIEIESTQIVRSFDDIDLAVMAPFTLVLAGKTDVANNALVYSRGDDVYYAGQFVTRENNTDDPRVKVLIKIYQESPAVRQAISAAFGNNDKLYTLPWARK